MDIGYILDICYWNNTTLNIKPLILELPCYIIDPKIEDFLICPWQARHKKIDRISKANIYTMIKRI